MNCPNRHRGRYTGTRKLIHLKIFTIPGTSPPGTDQRHLGYNDMEYSVTGRGLNSLLGFRGLLINPLQDFLFVIVEGLNFVLLGCALGPGRTASCY
jgi:hypothetical protein